MCVELKFAFLKAALWATCHGHRELGPFVPGPALPQRPGALSSWGLRMCAVILVPAYLVFSPVSLARRTGSWSVGRARQWVLRFLFTATVFASFWQRRG